MTITVEALQKVSRSWCEGAFSNTYPVFCVICCFCNFCYHILRCVEFELDITYCYIFLQHSLFICGQLNSGSTHSRHHLFIAYNTVICPILSNQLKFCFVLWSLTLRKFSQWVKLYMLYRHMNDCFHNPFIQQFLMCPCIFIWLTVFTLANIIDSFTLMFK